MWVCTDPDAHDHRPRWGRSPFQQPRPRMADLPAHKAEAARANRRDWLAQLAARKTAPKDTATFLALTLAQHPT